MLQYQGQLSTLNSPHKFLAVFYLMSAVLFKVPRTVLLMLAHTTTTRF